jgi:hypothetical protein
MNADYYRKWSSTQVNPGMYELHGEHQIFARLFLDSILKHWTYTIILPVQKKEFASKKSFPRKSDAMEHAKAILNTIYRQIEEFIPQMFGGAPRTEQQKEPGTGSSHNQNHNNHAIFPTNGKLTRQQALDVLGLPTTADKAMIVAQHRKLAIANHPDHGGSNYLMVQLNLAKDILLVT